MRRHLIIFYTVLIVLLLSGRYAWTHCEWDWIARISAVGVIIGIVIERWNVLVGRPDAASAQPAERLPILLLCAGTFVAGFGELIGNALFGCQ